MAALLLSQGNHTRAPGLGFVSYQVYLRLFSLSYSWGKLCSPATSVLLLQPNLVLILPALLTLQLLIIEPINFVDLS